MDEYETVFTCYYRLPLISVPRHMEQLDRLVRRVDRRVRSFTIRWDHDQLGNRLEELLYDAVTTLRIEFQNGKFIPVEGAQELRWNISW